MNPSYREKSVSALQYGHSQSPSPAISIMQDPSKQEVLSNLEIEMMTDLYNRCVSSYSLYQEPITQREGALNLCMYADSTCCQIALAQHSLHSLGYGLLPVFMCVFGFQCAMCDSKKLEWSLRKTNYAYACQRKMFCGNYMLWSMGIRKKRLIMLL